MSAIGMSPNCSRCTRLASRKIQGFPYLHCLAAELGYLNFLTCHCLDGFAYYPPPQLSVQSTQSSLHCQQFYGFSQGYSSLAEGLVAKDELLNLVSLGPGPSSLWLSGVNEQQQKYYLGSSHPICPMMPSIHIRFSRTTEKNCTLSVTEVTWTRLASQEPSSSFQASITSISLSMMASAFSPA
ncbi:hypothetical protein EYF80_013148 [Liparis tanakae]|uniref:Uncharacterized protein n=1 Tax=Liparis tanakae TaxID=230148 RepID=A0A4Z2IFF7_9TELE|nr:hypothetical protein EYF80_013148 [Liparis tanakae]